MIPVLCYKQDDPRPIQCWIDPGKVLRVNPLYGVKDSKEDFYWEADPGFPKAELFGYELVYCDGQTYRTSKEVIEETFLPKCSEPRSIGFPLPKSKVRPKAD